MTATKWVYYSVDFLSTRGLYWSQMTEQKWRQHEVGCLKLQEHCHLQHGSTHYFERFVVVENPHFVLLCYPHCSHLVVLHALCHSGEVLWLQILFIVENLFDIEIIPSRHVSTSLLHCITPIPASITVSLDSDSVLLTVQHETSPQTIPSQIVMVVRHRTNFKFCQFTCF